jgi:hypothetical protein
MADLITALVWYFFACAMWLWYHVDNYRDANNSYDEQKVCLQFAWLTLIWPLVILWVYGSKLYRMLRDSFAEAWL